MKRIAAIIALLTIIMPHFCMAEEKLFITDVLDKKEVEGAVNFSHVHLSYDISSHASAASANRTVDQTFSSFGLNVGVGRGVEVGASIPYVFSERSKIDYYALPYRATRVEEEGFGDISLRGKYRICDEANKPLTLVAGLGVKLDTASEEIGTGTTDIKPFVAASVITAQGLRPYVIYQFTSRNHGSGDTHGFEFGAEKRLNDDIGLYASLEADFHSSSDQLRSRETYHFTIESYIRMVRNLYVIPGMAYGIHSSFDEKEGHGHFESYNSIQFILNFYCLF